MPPHDAGRAGRPADIELDDVRKRVRRAARRAANSPDQAAPRHVGLGAQPRPACRSPPTRSSGCSATSTSTRSSTTLRDANWWWLAFALVLAQLPRIPAAVSTMGSIEQPLPLGPLTALQFAICFVNLAIPSTRSAGRHQRPVLPALRRRADDRDLGRGHRLRLGVRRADRAVPRAVLPVRRRPRSDHRHDHDKWLGHDRPHRHRRDRCARSHRDAPCRPFVDVWSRPSAEASRRSACLALADQAAATVRRQPAGPGAVRRRARRRASARSVPTCRSPSCCSSTRSCRCSPDCCRCPAGSASPRRD